MTLVEMRDSSAGYDNHSSWWTTRMLKRPNNKRVAEAIFRDVKTAFDTLSPSLVSMC